MSSNHAGYTICADQVSSFLRLLALTPEGEDLPPGAKWLLTVVATSQRDGRPVRLYDEPLCATCGWPRRQTLARARALLIGTGWLSYSPPVEGRRLGGLYAVRIPARYLSDTDNPEALGPPRQGGILCGIGRGSKRACVRAVTKPRPGGGQ